MWLCFRLRLTNLSVTPVSKSNRCRCKNAVLSIHDKCMKPVRRAHPASCSSNVWSKLQHVAPKLHLFKSDNGPFDGSAVATEGPVSVTCRRSARWRGCPQKTSRAQRSAGLLRPFPMGEEDPCRVGPSQVGWCHALLFLLLLANSSSFLLAFSSGRTLLLELNSILSSVLRIKDDIRLQSNLSTNWAISPPQLYLSF
jgi:hypothetical protein